MDDETYGKNEPPEPEDLDMGDDAMIGDEDDDMDDGDDAPPEEEQRLPDFEDEAPTDEKVEESEDKVDITNTGGNAGADEELNQNENMEEAQDENNEENVDFTKEKGDKLPDEEANKDKGQDGGKIENDDLAEDEKNADEEQNVQKKDDNEAMVTDENEAPENVDVVKDDNEEEDESESAETKNLEQEFARSKDKTNDNAINALDAMDVDSEEKEREIKEDVKEKEKSKEGKSIDMADLKDAITIDTQTVERNTDTIFGHVKNESLALTGDGDQEMVPLDQVPMNDDDSHNTPEDMKRWLKLCQDTSDLTQNLTEQLRLILEATKATRFKGDFKSGKRINMRKVIPFIASNYRKDKIWLRRTKPSKREYNIIVAVDDSTSMRENNVNELVDQSLAVLCQSLSSLEVGKFGLVKFGKDTEIIQSLQVKTFTLENFCRPSVFT